LRIARWESDVVVTFRERKGCSLIAPPIVGRAICRRSQLSLEAARASRGWESDVVVTFRERKGCSLIDPPIVGRAICRRSQLSS
jgi:hypothetical protein